MGFEAIGPDHPLSRLVVNNPHYIPSACEKCQICKLPFNFTNLDLHIEGGCAKKIMEMQKEKEARVRADMRKKGLKVPKVKKLPVVPLKAKEKKQEKVQPLSNEVTITVQRLKPKKRNQLKNGSKTKSKTRSKSHYYEK